MLLTEPKINPLTKSKTIKPDIEGHQDARVSFLRGFSGSQTRLNQYGAVSFIHGSEINGYGPVSVA